MEVTQAASPVKLFEYLSIGKRIIATSWEETELFNIDGERIVFTSKNDDEFMKNIDYVANMTQEEKDIITFKSKEIARQNTWEQRFVTIENAIEDFAESKGIRL
jgi:hypothetical protein